MATPDDDFDETFELTWRAAKFPRQVEVVRVAIQKRWGLEMPLKMVDAHSIEIPRLRITPGSSPSAVRAAEAMTAICTWVDQYKFKLTIRLPDVRHASYITTARFFSRYGFEASSSSSGCTWISGEEWARLPTPPADPSTRVLFGGPFRAEMLAAHGRTEDDHPLHPPKVDHPGR